MCRSLYRFNKIVRDFDSWMSWLTVANLLFKIEHFWVHPCLSLSDELLVGFKKTQTASKRERTVRCPQLLARRVPVTDPLFGFKLTVSLF